MQLITAVQKAKSRNGMPTAFFAVLSDYCAFDEEEPWVRAIMKSVCDRNYHQQLSTMRLPDRNNSLAIQDIIYRLSSQYGYETCKISQVLHKLALGLGTVKPDFDWDGEFTPASGKGRGKPSPRGAALQACPDCGRPYYKLYSSYCAYCGRKR
jgi:hypothetical protein